MSQKFKVAEVSTTETQHSSQCMKDALRRRFFEYTVWTGMEVGTFGPFCCSSRPKFGPSVKRNGPNGPFHALSKDNIILGVKSIRFHEIPVDSTLCPAKNGRLKLGNHRSYSLQRRCFLRRSVAGLTDIRFRQYCCALIGPWPMMSIIIVDVIT